jgi:hypothetical protein
VKSYDGEGTIEIPIVNDAAREGPERFVVELTEVTRRSRPTASGRLDRGRRLTA